jgi:hypothetical protein
VVAFTEGEARFIDFDAEGDGDNLYEPSRDFVPVLSEPYVDANDNGVWDSEERYFDANRNGEWDIDVFGRGELVTDLRCAQDGLSRLAQGRALNNPDCRETLVGTIANEANLTALIEELAELNPSNLRAYIWSSALVLGVGLPYNTDEALSLTCVGVGCSVEAPAGFSCPGATGADIYLDAVAGNPAFKLDLKLTDSNLNCLGVLGVNFNLTLPNALGRVEGPMAPNELSLVSGDPALESCFDETRTSIPRARHYVLYAAAPPTITPPEEPSFSLEDLSISVEVPDHRLSEGGALTINYGLKVGVCQ